MKTRRLAFLLLPLCLLCLVSLLITSSVRVAAAAGDAGGGGSSSPTPTPSLGISKSTLQLNEGENTQLEIEVVGYTVERVVWTTSDSSVVAVGANTADQRFGVVSAVSPGTATVKAAVSYSGGTLPDAVTQEFSCAVTVSGVSWGFYEDAGCATDASLIYGVPRLMTPSSGFTTEQSVYLKLAFFGSCVGQQYTVKQTHPGFDKDLVAASQQSPAVTPQPDSLVLSPSAAAYSYVIKVSSAGDDTGRAFLDLMQGSVSVKQFEFLVWNSAVVTGITVKEDVTGGKDLLVLEPPAASASPDPDPSASSDPSPSASPDPVPSECVGVLKATVTTDPTSTYPIATGMDGAKKAWGISEGTEAIATASWADSDYNSITFTAVKPGSFRSYVTAGDVRAVYTVTVSGLVLAEKATFTAGNTGTLELLRYGKAVSGNLVWSVEDNKTAVLTVDSSTGKITAAAEGTATVTCTCGAYSAACEVTVNKAPEEDPGGSSSTPGELRGVSMLTDTITLDAGKTKSLTAYLVPDNVTGQITWTSSDSAVAVCDPAASTGEVSSLEVTITAVSPGEATITAACGIKSTSCRVVTSGIVLDKTSLVLGMNSSAQVGKTLYGNASSLPGTSWVWALKNEADAKYVRVNPGSGLLTGASATPTGKTVTVICSQGNYSASLEVTVLEDTATVIETSISDGVLPLEDVLYQMKKMCGAYTLDYASSFSVSPSEGILYYGYISSNNPGAGVAVSDRFYTDGKIEHKQLERVCFVPKSGFTGIASVYFTLSPQGGENISGVLRITVSPSTKIRYTSENGEAVQLQADDFSARSRAINGHPVSAVRFDLPNSRYGWLYSVYRGEEIYGGNVSADTYFYPSATPSIGEVSFVPRKDYAGTFTFSYTASSTDGSTFTGTVEITVKRASGNMTGDLSYTAYTGERLYFSLTDFSAMCQSAGLGTPNYVVFNSLPSSSSGTLYADSGTQKASAGTRYYYSSSSTSSTRRFLGSVNFLASKTGTVSIPFTARDTAGASLTGTITITVLSGDGRAETVTYYSSGMPVTFTRADFVEACRTALPASLTSVTFTLPDPGDGTLYASFKDLQNNKLLSSNKAVSASELIKVTFVPKGGMEGSVYISYTATDSKGNLCTGTVRIYMLSSTSSGYFEDLSSCLWAVSSLDFMARYGIVSGTGGRNFSPNLAMRRGDIVLMLCNTFDYPSVGTVSYSDVPGNSYYAGAIASAKALGLLTEGDGLFRPNESLTLEDAAVFLYRALAYEGIITKGDHTELLSRFADGDQVSSYAREAVAAMVYLGVFRGDTSGNLRPLAPVTRVSMAVILYRVIT